jgi:hypothetical protein
VLVQQQQRALLPLVRLPLELVWEPVSTLLPQLALERRPSLLPVNEI